MVIDLIALAIETIMSLFYICQFAIIKTHTRYTQIINEYNVLYIEDIL